VSAVGGRRAPAPGESPAGLASVAGRVLPRRAARAWRAPPRSPAAWLAALVLGLAAFLSLYPTLMVLRGSFSGGRLGTPAALTLQNYVAVYANAETYALLATTLVYAVGVAASSVVVGFVLAWIGVRTNAPLARQMPWLVFVPYALPNTLSAVAWIILANPNTGLLNEAARAASGGAGPLFNVYSLPGMVFVATNHLFALAFTFLAAALHALDPALEEAASTSGASPWRRLWHVSLPQAWPAIFSTLALLFIVGLESFDVPAFVGIPAGIYVFTTQIFVQVSVRSPPDYGRAATYGVLPMVLALLLAWYYQRTIAGGERYATIKGKAYRPRRVDLGPWRWLATALFLAVFAVSAVLPVGTLALVSLAPTLAAARDLDLAHLGLQHYQTILADPVALRAIRNTLVLALLGATTAMGLGFFIAYITTRSRLPARGLIEYVLFLPFALASVVLAVGILWGYVRFPIAVYGTIWILLIGYVTKFLPYGFRATSTSLIQVHRELEEAAHMSGAGLGRIVRSILLPLTLPGLVGGWSILVVLFMREFSMSLMLWSPGSEVVTVLFYDYWTNGRFGPLGALGMLLVLVSLAIVFAVRRASRLDTVAAG